jgi:hypothetical protein
VPRFGSIAVDEVKIRDYCLSDSHPRGRHKARVFRSRLGLTSADVELLRRALLDAVRIRPQDLRQTANDQYGQRYVLDFNMTGTAGSATVRSAWIVLVNDDVLRFLSCYVL